MPECNALIFVVPTRCTRPAFSNGCINLIAPCLVTPSASQISRGVMLLWSRSNCNNCSCFGRSTSFVPVAAENFCTRVQTRSSVSSKPSAQYSSQPVKSSPSRRTASSAA